MTDILIQEQGSGGEMLVRNNDIVTVNGVENGPYLSHFGGEDWMYNDLLLIDGDDIQFTGITERILRETPLNSTGRVTIEQAMQSDLAWMENDIPGTTVNVDVSITGPNKIKAPININGSTVVMIWNPDESFLTYEV